MKIAGLMPVSFCASRKETTAKAIRQLLDMCDEVILLDDGNHGTTQNELRNEFPQVRAWVQLQNREDDYWNDWTNRNMLLLEAARYDCRWVFWLDDDEEVVCDGYPNMVLHDIAEASARNPMLAAVQFPWLHLWNDNTHIRVDGKWGSFHKPFLQKNPFFSGLIFFKANPEIRLHHWPVQAGTLSTNRQFYILHHGLMTEKDRQDRIQKYRDHDPEGRFTDKLMEDTLSAQEGVQVVDLATYDVRKDWRE